MKDCLKLIFNFLRLPDLLNCRRVCKWYAEYIGDMKYFGKPISQIGAVMKNSTYSEHNLMMSGDLAFLYGDSNMIMFASKREYIKIPIGMFHNSYVCIKDNKIFINDVDIGMSIIDKSGCWTTGHDTCFDTPNFKITPIPGGYISNRGFHFRYAPYFEFDKKLFIIKHSRLVVYDGKKKEYYLVGKNASHRVCNDIAIIGNFMFFKGGDVMKCDYFRNIIAAGRDFLFAKINGKYTEIKS